MSGTASGTGQPRPVPRGNGRAAVDVSNIFAFLLLQLLDRLDVLAEPEVRADDAPPRLLVVFPVPGGARLYGISTSRPPRRRKSAFRRSARRNYVSSSAGRPFREITIAAQNHRQLESSASSSSSARSCGRSLLAPPDCRGDPSNRPPLRLSAAVPPRIVYADHLGRRRGAAATRLSARARAGPAVSRRTINCLRSAVVEPIQCLADLRLASTSATTRPADDPRRPPPRPRRRCDFRIPRGSRRSVA